MEQGRSVDEKENSLMATDIYIYCPTGEDGAYRGDLEDELEGFLGEAGELTGGGSGIQGYNIDLSLNDGEEVEEWVLRLRNFLQKVGVRPGTFFEVFPEGWEPGMPHRGVEIFGEEIWITDRQE